MGNGSSFVIGYKFCRYNLIGHCWCFCIGGNMNTGMYVFPLKKGQHSNRLLNKQPEVNSWCPANRHIPNSHLMNSPKTVTFPPVGFPTLLRFSRWLITDRYVVTTPFSSLLFFPKAAFSRRGKSFVGAQRTHALCTATHALCTAGAYVIFRFGSLTWVTSWSRRLFPSLLSQFNFSFQSVFSFSLF